MNRDQSEPLLWGHVTQPRPIRGRGNSHVGASRAPRAETGRSQRPGPVAVTTGAERERDSLQSSQPRNLSSGSSSIVRRTWCKISLFWNFIVQIVGNVNPVTRERKQKLRKSDLLTWEDSVKVFGDKLWAESFSAQFLWPQHKRRSCRGRKIRVKLGSWIIWIFRRGIQRVTSGWFDLVLESQSILFTLSSFHHVVSNFI